MDIRTLNSSHPDFQADLLEIRTKLSPAGDVVSPGGRRRTMEVFGEALTPEQVVRRICDDVRQQGISSVVDYGNRLDSVDFAPADLAVTSEQLEAAHASAAPEFLAAIRRIVDNVFEFQSAILHSDTEVCRDNGVILRQRYTPLRRVGLCIPGGAAAYPSSVIMTAVPARAAGVKEIVVVAPPTKFGANNPDILAVCHELGITEVYRVGGAQAVAALGHGVEGIPAVDKIVGPGNLFVALAKKHMYGTVDIDSIAGPSEVVVIADESSDAKNVASEMLAQAEHSPGSSILVTWSQSLVDGVQQQIASQLETLSRADLIRPALKDFGCIILARDAAETCDIVNMLAPEHLYIGTGGAGNSIGHASLAHELSDQITNAGATFIGEFSPVAIGDYFAGPSHCLPTGGTPRWASGLCSNSFLRSSSVIEFNEIALRDAADDVRLIAEREQLTAHARSVDIRFED